MHWSDTPLGLILVGSSTALLSLLAMRKWPELRQYANLIGTASMVAAAGTIAINPPLGIACLAVGPMAGIIGMCRGEDRRWSLALMLGVPALIGLMLCVVGMGLQAGY